MSGFKTQGRHTHHAIQFLIENEFLISVFKSSEYTLLNTYSMKQPDLYYFKTIKMTAQS